MGNICRCANHGIFTIRVDATAHFAFNDNGIKPKKVKTPNFQMTYLKDGGPGSLRVKSKKVWNEEQI